MREVAEAALAALKGRMLDLLDGVMEDARREMATTLRRQGAEIIRAAPLPVQANSRVPMARTAVHEEPRPFQRPGSSQGAKEKQRLEKQDRERVRN